MLNAGWNETLNSLYLYNVWNTKNGFIQIHQTPKHVWFDDICMFYSSVVFRLFSTEKCHSCCLCKLNWIYSRLLPLLEFNKMIETAATATTKKRKHRTNIVGHKATGWIWEKREWSAILQDYISIKIKMTIKMAQA